MIRPLTQTDLTLAGGDCFKTCVAMVLDLDQHALPNFCHLPDWWQKFQAWLAERRLVAVEVNLYSGVLCRPTPGVPVILTGDSHTHPDGLHSVVGVTAAEGFELLYDPNPGGRFIKGPPRSVLFFAPLRPDLLLAGMPHHGRDARPADAA